ncbi:hypothetical protein PybrP1_004733 [[Pythium] brassicae (nom. inval.)]|nr:hypothetical protein PybrP1_004733 [[Pythium] brassicae (nom. inval.)]
MGLCAAFALLQAEFRQAKHTIILVQYTRDPNSRTYLDFESVNGGMDGVVKMYEAKLKQLNPNMKNITYDIQDLYNYIDSLVDLSALPGLGDKDVLAMREGVDQEEGLPGAQEPGGLRRPPTCGRLRRLRVCEAGASSGAQSSCPLVG